MLKANNNSGKEKSSLPPIKNTIARITDKITIMLLTPFVIFLLLALTNQESKKNIRAKIIIPTKNKFIY